MLHQDTIINERYRITRLVGRGGMGDVYAAVDEQLGRDVALKILRPDFAADPKDRERFLREAQIAAQIVHPNVVRTYDISEAAEGPFLVQELLDGHTLEEAIPLPPRQALTVALAIADALEHIHTRGYVHCDVKPQNVMLLTQGNEERVVLLDFGIARAQDADTISLIATPYYLAPEQARGDAPMPASDLYALGIVLYHMLTGRLPFDAPIVQDIISGHLYEPLPPLDIADPHVFEIEAIVLKLTAKQPTDRYPSAAALRADLGDLLEGMLHTQPLGSRIRRSLRPMFRRKVRSVTLPSLAICVALGVAWMHTPDVNSSVAMEAARLVRTQSVPAGLNIPNVLGLPLDQAQRLIEQAGLEVVVGKAISSNQPAGTVVSMTPGPDQSLMPGAQVIIQISAGPEPLPLLSLTFPSYPEPTPAVVAAGNTLIDAGAEPASAANGVLSATMSVFAPEAAPVVPAAVVVPAEPDMPQVPVPPLAAPKSKSNKDHDLKDGTNEEEGTPNTGHQPTPWKKSAAKEVKEAKELKQHPAPPKQAQPMNDVKVPAPSKNNTPSQAAPPKSGKKYNAKSDKEPNQEKQDKGKGQKSGKNQ